MALARLPLLGCRQPLEPISLQHTTTNLRQVPPTIRSDGRLAAILARVGRSGAQTQLVSPTSCRAQERISRQGVKVAAGCRTGRSDGPAIAVDPTTSWAYVWYTGQDESWLRRYTYSAGGVLTAQGASLAIGARLGSPGKHVQSSIAVRPANSAHPMGTVFIVWPTINEPQAWNCAVSPGNQATANLTWNLSRSDDRGLHWRTTIPNGRSVLQDGVAARTATAPRSRTTAFPTGCS